MEWNKDIPEMSVDFCDRVIDASRDIEQRRPISLRMLWERATAALPVNPSWAIASMAIVFVIGVAIGIETYTIVDVMEIMQI